MSSSVSSEAIAANPYLVRTTPAQRDERFGLVYGSKPGVRAELRVSQKCCQSADGVLQSVTDPRSQQVLQDCYRCYKPKAATSVAKLLQSVTD